VGGSAVLDSNVLVDSLVTDVIDGLRGELHPQFGVRPFRVYTVKRTWAGAIVGDGASGDVVVELAPQPRVELHEIYEMTPAGKNRIGDARLTEVSLTYTYAELTGGSLADNVQWLIRLSEAYGQGQPDRYFVIARPPEPDRERDMGWRVVLRAADVPGCNG
jgi:hypothetical protein